MHRLVPIMLGCLRAVVGRHNTAMAAMLHEAFAIAKCLVLHKLSGSHLQDVTRCLDSQHATRSTVWINFQDLDLSHLKCLQKQRSRPMWSIRGTSKTCSRLLFKTTTYITFVVKPPFDVSTSLETTGNLRSLA